MLMKPVSPPPNDCVLTTHGKWVLKSYFDAYGTLDDVFFQVLRKRNSPRVRKMDKDNPGNALKLSGLERHLVGEGSHSRLLTSIRMDTQDGSKDQRLMESREVIITERLPAGVFADPFELQHLHELGGKLLNALSKSGYSSVQFGERDVLVCCSPKSNLQRNPCLSIFTTGVADKPAIGRLVWKVP